MIARGRLQNSVIVLEEGVRLPEGQEVTVLAAEPPSKAPGPHSILGIATVSLGTPLRPLTDDDLLGEMLEDRR